jgi:outer membrane protein
MQEQNLEKPEPNQEVNDLLPEKKIVESGEGPRPAFFTFNFNTLLGIVLLAGLVVLYVLFFTSRRSPEPPAIPLSAQKISGKPLSVVFVNIDSLNTHYEYVKILRRDLESTGKRLQSEVLSEQSALEKEAADFQRQISSNSIPEEKAKVIYEQLMEKQQSLMQKKERYTQQVAEQEMNMNIRLVDSVTVFLKRFNRQYQFDYIMGYKNGGEILISNETFDITRSVLDELNKEYRQRQK